MRKALTAILLCLLLPTYLFSDSILTCTFVETSTFRFEGGKWKLKATDNDNLKIVFSGLNTKNPVMKANNGEANLILLRSYDDTLWLAEKPELGGINLITIFLKDRVATFTKQYKFGFGEYAFPYAYMMSGVCE